MVFSKIVLFGRYRDINVKKILDLVRTHLEARGLFVVEKDTTSRDNDNSPIDLNDLPAEVNLGIVVGGDGTMLHVARSLASVNIPVVGINMGRLGFLTDIPADALHDDLDELLQGDYEIEQRIMLNIQLINQNNDIDEHTALNDVVLSKGNTGRILEFNTNVDGEEVGKSRGDGLIVATPTGSTAHALSAGGPILHPLLPAMVLTPICPHTMGQRPVVLSERSKVEITLAEETCEHGFIYIDGIGPITFHSSQILRICKSNMHAMFVRIKSHSHYDALHTKLGWG